MKDIIMARSTTTGRKRAGTKQLGTSNMLYRDVVSIAGPLFRSQQRHAADRLSALAGVTRDLAVNVPDMPTAAAYIEAAAERLDGLAGYMVETEAEDIIQDVAVMARRNPLMTMGFALASGFLVMRMAQSHYEQIDRTGYGTSSRQTRRSSKKQRRRTTNGSEAQANA
jgi:hypothetical protein